MLQILARWATGTGTVPYVVYSTGTVHIREAVCVSRVVWSVREAAWTVHHVPVQNHTLLGHSPSANQAGRRVGPELYSASLVYIANIHIIISTNVWKAQCFPFMRNINRLWPCNGKRTFILYCTVPHHGTKFTYDSRVIYTTILTNPSTYRSVPS